MAKLTIVLPHKEGEGTEEDELDFEVALQDLKDKRVWELMYSEMEKDCTAEGGDPGDLEEDMKMIKGLFAICTAPGIDNLGKWLELPAADVLKSDDADVRVEMEMKEMFKAFL